MKNKDLLCSIEGCIAPAKIRGWCAKHYQRWFRWGSPDITKKSAKLPSGVAARNQLVLSYKNGAKERGLEFALTDGQIDKLFSQICCYCGAQPEQIKTNGRNTGEFIYNGIDRIDNNKGYTIDNVVACCGKCNFAKNQLTPEEFIQHAEKIVSWMTR